MCLLSDYYYNIADDVNVNNDDDFFITIIHLSVDTVKTPLFGSQWMNDERLMKDSSLLASVFLLMSSQHET